MRYLVFLIVISAFMVWFGVNFRQVMPRAAKASLALGGILIVFILIGILRLA